MKEVTDEEGRSYIGDSVATDENGHRKTIGRPKDTTTCGGENTHFCETEEPSHMYLVTSDA